MGVTRPIEMVNETDEYVCESFSTDRKVLYILDYDKERVL